MAKFPEAMARMYHNVFVCKKCKTKKKTTITKVLQGKVTCRKCGSKSFRAIKKGK